jgi:tetratricopeptide (TPR) repeat protein
VLLLARVVDPTSGEDIASLRETARDSTVVLEAIDRLSAGVRKQLGESARSLKAAPPLARASTRSVEALRKYTQALSLKENSTTYGDALDLMDQAVQLDTGFALAWRELAEMRPLASGRWEAIKHAMANRDRLTPAERAFTEATYYDFGNQWEEAISALRTVVNLDPGNATAWGNLSALLMIRTEDYAEGLEAARRALEASGYAIGRYQRVIDAEMANGRRDVARRLLDSLHAAAPDSPEAIMTEIAWLAHFRQYRQADSVAEALLRRSQANPWLVSELQLRRRNLLLLQGRPGDADVQHRRYLEYHARSDNDVWALTSEFAYVQLLSRMLGPTPVLERRLDQALRRFPIDSMNPLDPAYLWMASSAAWTGRVELARDLIRRWGAAQPREVPVDSTSVLWVLGDIALAEGRNADAAVLEGRSHDLARGIENMFPHRGHPHDLLGNSDSAIVLYQGYLGRVTNLDFRLFWLDVAHLAETYEALGRNFELLSQADSAAQYYQALLDLWQNAEPALEPKRAGVRDALARVSAEKGSQVPIGTSARP